MPAAVYSSWEDLLNTVPLCETTLRDIFASAQLNYPKLRISVPYFDSVVLVFDGGTGTFLLPEPLLVDESSYIYPPSKNSPSSSFQGVGRGDKIVSPSPFSDLYSAEERLFQKAQRQHEALASRERTERESYLADCARRETNDVFFYGAKKKSAARTDVEATLDGIQFVFEWHEGMNDCCKDSEKCCFCNNSFANEIDVFESIVEAPERMPQFRKVIRDQKGHQDYNDSRNLDELAMSTSRSFLCNSCVQLVYADYKGQDYAMHNYRTLQPDCSAEDITAIEISYLLALDLVDYETIWYCNLYNMGRNPVPLGYMHQLVRVDAGARLSPPVDAVARLSPPVDAVAQLSPPVDAVTRLKKRKETQTLTSQRRQQRSRKAAVRSEEEKVTARSKKKEENAKHYQAHKKVELYVFL